jgi:hypothetical protein
VLLRAFAVIKPHNYRLTLLQFGACFKQFVVDDSLRN